MKSFSRGMHGLTYDTDKLVSSLDRVQVEGLGVQAHGKGLTAYVLGAEGTSSVPYGVPHGSTLSRKPSCLQAVESTRGMS